MLHHQLNSEVEKKLNTQLNIHVLIPSRGGSKSIPKKNIRRYGKLPLLAHSIMVAKDSKLVNRIVVSTDCEKIREIALQNGAEAPFLRPSSISGDFSTDLECFQHYLFFLKSRKQPLPDLIVHLRPTYPNRTQRLLDDCISKFTKVQENYTSLRTVVPIEKSLFKMYTVEDNNILTPSYKEFKNIKEPNNQVRQILPKTYLHNGCIDIVKRETIENGSISGDRIYAYIMDKKETNDIDTEDDWKNSLAKKFYDSHYNSEYERSSPIKISKFYKKNTF